MGSKVSKGRTIPSRSTISASPAFLIAVSVVSGGVSARRPGRLRAGRGGRGIRLLRLLEHADWLLEGRGRLDLLQGGDRRLPGLHRGADRQDSDRPRLHRPAGFRLPRGALAHALLDRDRRGHRDRRCCSPWARACSREEPARDEEVRPIVAGKEAVTDTPPNIPASLSPRHTL